MKDLETAPIPRPGNAPPAGLRLGYVRLEGQRDTIDLLCRVCGQHLGSEVWAEAVSDSLGGITWSAPICYRCMTREGERRATEPERASRLAALVMKLAELRPKRPAAEPVPGPEPRPRLRLRRKRPATRAAGPAEKDDGS